MQKPQFVENEIYHVFNRGVERRKTFMDKQDYLRFIHCLFEFNDRNPTLNLGRYLGNKKYPMNEVQLHSLGKQPRKLLVEILIFTLMPNHFHLLLKQKSEKGIVKFMQKLGTGYTNYFNQKYERVGGLFQGRFKAILLDNDSHFVHLPYYIHANPLELSSDKNPQANNWNFLEKYRWSSLLDYIGKKNFPSVTQRNFLLNFFDGEEKYRKEIKEWIKERSKNFEKIKEVTLD